MTVPPALNCAPRRMLPAPTTMASCTPLSWTRLIWWAIFTTSSMLMPPPLPLWLNPSPLSLRTTRLYFGWRESSIMVPVVGCRIVCPSSIIGLHGARANRRPPLAVWRRPRAALVARHRETARGSVRSDRLVLDPARLHLVPRPHLPATGLGRSEHMTRLLRSFIVGPGKGDARR